MGAPEVIPTKASSVQKILGTSPDVATMMKKMVHEPADVNRTFSVMRKIFNLAEVWGCQPDGTNPCRHVPM